MNNLLIEAGVTRVEDAVAAERAGAHRLELNSALVLGGLTPSWGLMGETIRAVKIPLMVMIRPRGGGFVYSPAELDTMQRDILAASTAGAKGAVFGPLTSQGEIDRPAVERFVRRAGFMQTVFHRAFDLCKDPLASLDQLIELGVTRVMTSGGGATALEGAEGLKKLIAHAAGRIEILPAGGIRSSNLAELHKATSCDQVHASFRKYARDETAWPSASPKLGAPAGDEAEHEAIDEEEVASLIRGAGKLSW